LRTVSDTSPILNLAAIGEVGLLESLFGQVSLPVAVDREIGRLQASDSRFAHVSQPAFVVVWPVQNTSLAAALKLQLHAGEAEAIALAIEHGARLLVDEHRARLVAAKLGVPTLGCLGILMEAKRRGLIPAIRPLLKKLETQAGFWVGAALRSQVLAAAGE